MFGVDLEEQFGYTDDLKYPYAYILNPPNKPLSISYEP